LSSMYPSGYHFDALGSDSIYPTSQLGQPYQFPKTFFNRSVISAG